jgi:hypothetical protein
MFRFKLSILDTIPLSELRAKLVRFRDRYVDDAIALWRLGLEDNEFLVGLTKVKTRASFAGHESVSHIWILFPDDLGSLQDLFTFLALRWPGFSARSISAHSHILTRFD